DAPRTLLPARHSAAARIPPRDRACGRSNLHLRAGPTAARIPPRDRACGRPNLHLRAGPTAARIPTSGLGLRLLEHLPPARPRIDPVIPAVAAVIDAGDG